MLFRRHRDNAAKRRRLNEIKIYINKEGEEIPQNLHDAKVKHVAMKMNQLFPNYMFWYSASKDDRVRIVGYRKGIVFTVVLNQDDIRCLWGYDSVVLIERMIDDIWERNRTLLLGCMMEAGEPEETVELMKYITSDDGNTGYKVTGVKRAKEKNGDDGDKENEGA